MNRPLPRLLCLTVLLLCLLVPVPPLVADEGAVKAAREAVSAAQDGARAAEEAMQARYVEIRADFDLLRSPDWARLDGPYVAAIRDAGDAPEKALPAAFEKAGLLSKPTSDRLAGIAAGLLEEAGEEETDPAAILARAIAVLFPEEEFADCWDKTLQDLPEVAGWREASDRVATAEQALAAAIAAAGAVKPPVDPAERPDVPPGMVLVPKGRYVLGPATGWEFDLRQNKAEKVRVDAFFIDVREVSNADYLGFLRSRGSKELPDGFLPAGFTASEDGISHAAGTGKQPVRGITFAAAEAFAKWAGKRLPTEEEWEAAARGKDGLLWPWGEEWDPEAANCRRDRGPDETEDPPPIPPADTGSHPKDLSPFGVLDMAGNVSELTATLAGRKPAKGRFERTDSIVVRGGNFREGRDSCKTTHRWTTNALSGQEEWIGFRCVISERDWK